MKALYWLMAAAALLGVGVGIGGTPNAASVNGPASESCWLDQHESKSSTVYLCLVNHPPGETCNFGHVTTSPAYIPGEPPTMSGGGADCTCEALIADIAALNTEIKRLQESRDAQHERINALSARIQEMEWDALMNSKDAMFAQEIQALQNRVYSLEMGR